MTIEYSSNNSGGDWWLDDKDWKALEAAGWKVKWYAEEERRIFKADDDGRWLGALASNASREGLTMKQAIDEWESITGEDSSALGCACCGAPHSFTAYDGDKYVTSYYPSYPSFGERYEESE